MPPVPRPDLTARYIKLAKELGEGMGYAHGWRRRVAERLGIDESMLSKILSGNRKVGWRLAERAMEKLALDPTYFSGPVRKAGKPAPRHSLVSKFESGTATVADVYALARAVTEAPSVAQAHAILRMRPPKSDQQVGALFGAASKLLDLLRAEREFRVSQPDRA
jgi:transcriptional regulator with XRE-family HTH domain